MESGRYRSVATHGTHVMNDDEEEEDEGVGAPWLYHARTQQ